jgi:hypothetical protein
MSGGNLSTGQTASEHDKPVHYLVSCSPHAWASGAWFLILSSILGIRPNAFQKELRIVNPELPEWLNFLAIRNMRIGKSRVGLDFSLRNGRTLCNVVGIEGDRLAVHLAFRK